MEAPTGFRQQNKSIVKRYTSKQQPPPRKPNLTETKKKKKRTTLYSKVSKLLTRTKKTLYPRHMYHPSTLSLFHHHHHHHSHHQSSSSSTIGTPPLRLAKLPDKKPTFSPQYTEYNAPLHQRRRASSTTCRRFKRDCRPTRESSRGEVP